MRNGTITRRMTRFSSTYNRLFKNFYHEMDFEAQLASLKKAIPEDRHTIIAKLCRMFRSCGIECEPERELSYYQALYKAHIASSDNPKHKIPTFDMLETRIMKTLFSAYSYYPSPDDFMLRLVNRLSSDKDRWESDTLRVRILKQFIKYGEYLSYSRTNNEGKKETRTIYGGKTYICKYIKDKQKLKTMPDTKAVLANLDDAIFDCLKTATRAQKKPDGKFGLLKLVDDLANSKFRTGNATKEGLYFFAIVYSMTYNTLPEADGAITIFDTDIEKNLFRDYYTSNMLRWISDIYLGKECEYEKDPSGQGINFRNFAEMIYLYYITKPALSPMKKIIGAHEMITRVKNSPLCSVNARTAQGSLLTMQIKAELFDPQGDDPLNLPEDEFEQYILANYNCHTNNLALLQVENQQNTAAAYYRQIIDDIHTCGYSLAKCCETMWFFDNIDISDPGFALRSELDSSREKVLEFCHLLKAAGQFVKDLSETPVSMSRTKLIALQYYFFIVTQEDEEAERMTFEEVFNFFKDNLDEILEKSNYQPLDEKNFFDILVVFSAYAQQNY